jgi:hypothetical protein
MSRRRLPPAALSVAAMSVVAFLVSACGSSSPPAGPLGPAGNPSEECTPGSLGHAGTVGLINATNSSGGTLIVDAIDLAQQRGIKLVGAYLTPGAGEAGTWATFPPPAASVSAYLDWSKRIPAVGARIAPGETISITLGIEPTTTTGSSTSDVEVLYHDGGSRFELRTNLALKIKVSPARCF